MEGPVIERVCHVRCSGKSGRSVSMDVRTLGQAQVLRTAAADVAIARERKRRGKLRVFAMLAGLLAIWCWARLLTGHPLKLGMPSLPLPPEMLPAFFLMVMLGLVLLVPLMGAGRS